MPDFVTFALIWFQLCFDVVCVVAWFRLKKLIDGTFDVIAHVLEVVDPSMEILDDDS